MGKWRENIREQLSKIMEQIGKNEKKIREQLSKIMENGKMTRKHKGTTL